MITPRSTFFLSSFTVSAMLFNACSPPSDLAEAEREVTSSPGNTLVNESMAAHGTRDAWYAAGLLQFRWTYHFSDRGPDATIDTTIVFDPQTLAVRHEVPNTSTSFGRIDDLTWISPAEAEFSPTPEFWSLTPIYFFGIPFVFNDPDARFELLPDVIAFEGNYYAQVEVTFNSTAGDSPDDTYILLIDDVSKITRGVIYTVTSTLVAPDENTPFKLITLDDLTDYNGILLPKNHRVYPVFDGVIGEQMRFVEIDSVQWLDRESVDLTIPEGAKIFK